MGLDDSENDLRRQEAKLTKQRIQLDGTMNK